MQRTITNHEDLCFHLIMIRTFERQIAKDSADYPSEAIEAMNDRIVEWKRAARKFLRKEREAHKDLPHLVRNDGIDGYVVLIPLPKTIADAETANEWFRANEYIEYRPTYYDCTGQLFTSWFKIINRNGRYWAYHCIIRDC